MHGSRGQRECQGERILVFVSILRKHSVELNQVRLITFQQPDHFFDRTVSLGLDGLVRLDVLVADGEFHDCTCGSFWTKGGPRKSLLCTAWSGQHSNRHRLRQSSFWH